MHVPDVYMPCVPAAVVDSGGAEPEVPASGRTAGSPRQTGVVGDGDVVAEIVRGGVGVRVVVGDGVGLAVPVTLTVWLHVPLREPLALRVTAALALADPLRRDATLRPRYVIRETAASELLPSAICHSTASRSPLV